MPSLYKLFCKRGNNKVKKSVPHSDFVSFFTLQEVHKVRGSSPRSIETRIPVEYMQNDCDISFHLETVQSRKCQTTQNVPYFDGDSVVLSAFLAFSSFFQTRGR